MSSGLAIVSSALGGVGSASRLLRIRVGAYAVIVLALRPKTLALAVLLPQLRVVVNYPRVLKLNGIFQYKNSYTKFKKIQIEKRKYY